MVNPRIDELSMMTYLSQFTGAKLKPGAPLKQRVDPSKVVQCKCTLKANGVVLSECVYPKTGTLGCHPEGVKVDGPGLAGGCVGEILNISVDTKDGGTGDLSIIMDGPQGLKAMCTFEECNGVANINITVHEAGVCKVVLMYGDQEVKGSPYHIRVWNPSLVAVYGPGITGMGTSVGLPADIFVDLAKSGMGAVEVSVAGPRGKTDAVNVVLTETPNVFLGSYVPAVSGTYRVSIKLEKWEVARSPFTVRICDLSKVVLGGPGLVKATVNSTNVIDVFTSHGIHGELAAKFTGLLGPQGVEYESVTVKEGHHQICYTPHQVGMMEVTVTCGGLVLQPSGVKVPCLDISTVTLHGLGLQSGIVAGTATEFFINASKSGPGDVEVLIHVDNPTGRSIPAQIIRKEQGMYNVRYVPTSAGEHFIVVRFGGLEIGGSPYRIQVCDPTLVKVSGLGTKMAITGVENSIDVCTDGAGLNEVSVEFGSPQGPVDVDYRVVDLGESYKQVYYTPHCVGTLDMVLNYSYEGELIASQNFAVVCIDPSMVAVDWTVGAHIPINEERQFVIHTNESGAQSVDVSIFNLCGEVVTDASMAEHAPGQYTITFMVSSSGQYQVIIKCGDVVVSGCPYTFTAFDPKAIKVYGPGLDRAFMSADNIIEVDTDEAGGSGEVGVIFGGSIQDLHPVQYEIKLTSENHYKINYTPPYVGLYEITITYAGVPIEPTRVPVPCIDPSSVTVNSPGLQSGIRVGSPMHFTVDASNAGPGAMDIVMTDAQGKEVQVEVEQTDQGIYNITYIPSHSGDYRTGITFAGLEVEGSPFVTQACNPNAVVARGAGLEKAIAAYANMFIVDSSQAGDGAINLAIEGPEECNIDCKDNGDHTYCVSYVPPQVGTYSVNIKFADVHIPGSPFLVSCSRAPPDASKCHAILQTESQAVTVDARGAGGTGWLEVGVWGAEVPARYVAVEHNGDYTFSVSYDIAEAGETMISIKWHGQHIDGSPFRVVNV